MGELQRIKESIQQQEAMKLSEVTYTAVTPLTATPRTTLDSERNAWYVDITFLNVLIFFLR